jgi:hypothetical protein
MYALPLKNPDKYFWLTYRYYLPDTDISYNHIIRIPTDISYGCINGRVISKGASQAGTVRHSSRPPSLGRELHMSTASVVWSSLAHPSPLTRHARRDTHTTPAGHSHSARASPHGIWETQNAKNTENVRGLNPSSPIPNQPSTVNPQRYTLYL